MALTCQSTDLIGASDTVTYFRDRRPGPEAAIEDAVAGWIPQVFGVDGLDSWTAGSLPIGAGIADLILVSYDSEVLVLSQVECSSIHPLAYLRVVGSARLDTIAMRLRQPERALRCCLEGLVEADVLWRAGNAFSLSPSWRDILPAVVTVEAKVSDWRRAVVQAGRNRLFSHHSFVALPTAVAHRVRKESVFQQLGIGILSVNEAGDVAIARRPRRFQPRVWNYYYELALVLAKQVRENSNAI